MKFTATNDVTPLPKMTTKMMESTWANIGFFLYQHDPDIRRLVRRLECLYLKILKKKQSTVFNQTCLDNDLLPKYTIAWTAIDRLSIIWKSDLTDKMKHSFFQVAVILILLYGCTTWTLTKRLKKKLDGNYTRMLRALLNKSWWQHPTRHQLYGHLPPIKQGWTHQWCTPMDPRIWPSKSRTISLNIHTAAMWGYRM